MVVTYLGFHIHEASDTQKATYQNANEVSNGPNNTHIDRQLQPQIAAHCQRRSIFCTLDAMLSRLPAIGGGAMRGRRVVIGKQLRNSQGWRCVDLDKENMTVITQG